MTTQLTVQWRDAETPIGHATGKMFVADAGTTQQITNLLTDLQALSDCSIVSYNKLVKTAFSGSPAHARDATHPYADVANKIDIVYNTANPAEFVRMSLFGPKTSIQVGSKNNVDPNQAALTQLNTDAAALLVSNSASAVTTARSAKFKGR